MNQQIETVKTRELKGLTLAQQEYFVGVGSKDRALSWAKSNGGDLPQLMLDKALTHLGFLNDFHVAISFANIGIAISACIGFLMSWRKFGGWATLFLFLSIATAMVTWAQFGRYSIPVRPLLHLGSAVTGAWIMDRLAGMFMNRSS